MRKEAAMKSKVQKAIKKMEESDLNLALWGGLFRNIIYQTDGGEKETCLILAYLEDNPRLFLDFIGRYLDKFGITAKLSIQGKELTISPVT
jgi:hypothetical protein